MDIKTIEIQHPELNKRNISLLIVDNNIDIPSTEFLIYEARYGGRHNGIGGRTSHKGKAIKMAELYRHLDEMGLKWDEASEEDIKTIRNAMLCWDKNGNEDYKNYEYEPISNDAMNHKLDIWFKFYKYMDKLGISNNMTLKTRRSKKYQPKKLLEHLGRRHDVLHDDFIDTWSLKVKPSPTKNSYHALSRTEFSRLRQHLRDIDIVYEALAVFMVETGLRITAALEATKDDFKGLLKLHSSGKTLDDVIPRSYIAKGDYIKQYDLPLRTMQEINELYLVRAYHERLVKYEEADGSRINILWLLENGKEVKNHDVWNAFREASTIMGRNLNTITPHWLRHTFATWTLIDIADRKGIPLQNTGTTPNPLFMLALAQKLGHADAVTTMRYIVTALKLMGLDVNSGPIKVSLRTFKRDKNSQKLVKNEAMQEFGDAFDDDYFDVIKYALSREIVIDDENL